ncbi:MAG: hypothetical protein JWO08_4501 [Verrucomicrobiaceae bacterium]|nr:hypothetical protein [Verrucomicrobiaceae bacterium]
MADAAVAAAKTTSRMDDKMTKSFLTSGCISNSGGVALAGNVAGTLWVLGSDGKVFASFPAR